jgi:hypothetical protein
MADDELYDPVQFTRGRTAESAEKAALLPGLTTTPYKAAGFVDHEASCLVLVMGKDGFKIGSDAYIVFQYVHIGLGEFGFTANGQVFRFVFSDLQPKLLTVHGRNLLRIFHQVGLRRMQWLRQADRDLRSVDGGADSEPVITRIEVEDWERAEVVAG